LLADPGQEPWPALASFSFREIVSGGAPSRATSIKAAWNPTELRLFFHAESGADSDGDRLEVCLDPVGDGESYFAIGIDPQNAVSSLVLRRSRSGYKRNPGWRCERLQTAVQRFPGSWTAEFSIPFASLGSIAPEGRWRANFHRLHSPPGQEPEGSAWSPTGLRTVHQPSRFGVLQFVAS